MNTRRKPRRTGEFVRISTVGSESAQAFIPLPLPPSPPLRLTGLHGLMEEAATALGRLDAASTMATDPGVFHTIFLYMSVRREAVVSSQIEGAHSTLSDLLRHEIEEAPGASVAKDVQEVSNYVAAMKHGLERLRSRNRRGGLPVSSRLIREMHKVLLSTGRGRNRQPGEFRRIQNWIGGGRPGNAVFVPPPPDRIPDCMSALERFVHVEDPQFSPLLRAALAHVQFETIHPFLDGNGRVGRLLITLQLCDKKVLKEPVLNLSLFFKRNRQRYYDLLQVVHDRGDWEAWLEFFLTGVRETADQAVETALRIIGLFEQDRQLIDRLGRPAGSAHRVRQHMQNEPITSVPRTAKALELSAPTAHKSIGHLVELGIVREITGKRRGRLYVYDEYLKILSEGADPDEDK